MINFICNLNYIYFDSISKFNLFFASDLLYLKKVRIFSKLLSVDSSFLNNFLCLSKIFFFWFNRKFSVLKVVKEFTKFSKGRTCLIFYLGLDIFNKDDIVLFLNYIFNVLFFLSSKLDDSFFFKRKENNFLYYFNNINYLIGLDSLKYFNWSIYFNLLLVFDYSKFFFKKMNNKNLKKKIINFYEKIFF